MNRRGFLRAALLTSVGLAFPLPNNPFAALPKASKAARRFIRFKITVPLLQDKLAFYSILDHELKRSDFDLDSQLPLAVNIGTMDNDFVTGCLTVELSIG